MGERVGDANFDQDIDIGDFNVVDRCTSSRSERGTGRLRRRRKLWSEILILTASHNLRNVED